MVMIIRHVGALSLGWRRRPDIGPNAWQRPDGKIRIEPTEAEPVVTVLDSKLPLWHNVDVNNKR